MMIVSNVPDILLLPLQTELVYYVLAHISEGGRLQGQVSFSRPNNNRIIHPEKATVSEYLWWVSILRGQLSAGMNRKRISNPWQGQGFWPFTMHIGD